MDKEFLNWKKEINQFIINITGLQDSDNNFNYKEYYNKGIDSNIVAFLIISQNKNNYKLYDDFEIWKYDYKKYISLVKSSDEIKSYVYNNLYSEYFKNNKTPIETCITDLKNKNLTL